MYIGYLVFSILKFNFSNVQTLVKVCSAVKKAFDPLSTVEVNIYFLCASGIKVAYNCKKKVILTKILKVVLITIEVLSIVNYV